ncbi:MAG: polyphosphate polymerase domain-containing protein [Oscillospiraceae bacterium]|nr:polyphosphate polymerase domain-containing protein [Oscillospiraceae bacterium]
MDYKTIFKRYELKYNLTLSQKEKLLQALKPHMALDQYGRSVIRNIYFDTNNYRLIRRSIERPVYKEKLRIRSYDKASSDSAVFVELKRKYESVVYKRRISLPEKAAMEWVEGKSGCKNNTQISNEIDYFLKFYQPLKPAAFLSYEREAFYSLNGDDFRVTFDENILCRQENLSLCSGVWGTPLLDKGTVLMEIKCSGGIPLWMTSFLSEERIYKTSFSKYGTAYEKLIYPNLQEELAYA